MPHIFISHSNKDDLATDRLADALKKSGLDVWVDHHKLDTSVPNWEKAIREQSLPSSSAVIFLMSKNSLASKICETECLLAEELKLPIHVLELEEVDSASIWLTIKLNHRATLYKNYDQELAKLIAALQSPLLTSVPTLTVVKRTGEDVMRNTLGYSIDEVRLVGREKDLEEIGNLIGKHVLQVYAVGGTGKSRIAAEIAVNHPTGMIWHRCSDNSHPSELLDLMRQHYQSPKEMLETDVLEKLESNPPLIIVDNAEAIADGTDQRKAYAEMLGKIRHHAPVLLTTRVIWDEFTPNKTYRLAALDDISVASQLTQEFATIEDIVYTHDQVTALAKAARLHPGLIKLAVRFKQLPFDVILARLNELKHREFEAAINQMIGSTIQQMESQDKDGEQASAWLKRLTVFRGGFTFEAALAVGPEDIDTDALYDSLVTLQRWGFVRRDKLNTERYYIDEIVIIGFLCEEGSHQLHFDFFFKSYGDEEINLREERHKFIHLDWFNIQQALEWGWENNPLLAISLVIALNYYAQIRLSVLSRESLYKMALEVAIKNNLLLQQGQCQILLTDVYRMKSEHGLAFQTAQAALAIAEREKDITLRCQALWSLGDISQQQSNYENAKSFFEEALIKYNKLPYMHIGKGNTLESLGNLARIDDDYEKAERYYLAALDIFKTGIAQLSRANVLLGLGDVARLKGDFQKSNKYYYDALNLYTVINYSQGIGNTLYALGVSFRVQEYFWLARDYHLQGYIIFSEIKEKLGLANSILGLAESHFSLLSDLNDTYEIENLFYTAERLFIDIKGFFGLGYVYWGLGSLYGLKEEYKLAETYLKKSLYNSKIAKDKRGELNALDALGVTYIKLNKYSEACKFYMELLSIVDRYPFLDNDTKTKPIKVWCSNNCKS